MAWRYKVCKLHKNSKTYTVIDRFNDRHEADRSKYNWEFYDKGHKFIVKRYSDKFDQ